MAIMYPSYTDEELEKLRKAEGGKHSAEVRFYRACQALENNVLVIHSRGFAQPNQKGKLAYGEIDFILAFANAGLMLVEVKGGRISLDDKGQWFTTNKEGVTKPLKRSPVAQVHEQRFHLQKIIENDPKWNDWGRGPIFYAPAVFFPNMEISQKEKFEAAAKGQVSFGFFEDLARLKDWTRDVNRHWHESIRNPADGALFLGKHGLELVLAILCPVISVPPDAARYSNIHVPNEKEPPNTSAHDAARYSNIHVPREEEPPTASAQLAGFAESPTRSWEELVRHTCKSPQSPPFVIENRGGAIKLTREWNPQLANYVWTKESNGSLDFLSDWEDQLLKRIDKAGVKRRVRWITLLSESSQSHMGDLPKEKQPRSKHTVRTLDAGPTLDVWQCMHPRVDGRPLAHPFVEQRRFLQLARGILDALEDFHARGFVHCDLNSGNIALPVRGVLTPQFSADRGEHVELEPVWDDIRVIDLDFSASDSVAPPIRLPHDLARFPRGTSRMSDHLRLRLSAIDDWLDQRGMSDRCYDPKFWSEPDNRSQLKCLQDLDWREDLHQLGYLLREIRDAWGGAGHVVTTGNSKEVNKFIGKFPDELMAWGSSGQISWNSGTVTNGVAAPKKLPHADYIAQIDRLLRQLDELPKAMVLYRQDHDLNYDPTTAPQISKSTVGSGNGPKASTGNETPVNPQLAASVESLQSYPATEPQVQRSRTFGAFSGPVLITTGLLLIAGVWLTMAKGPELSIDEWRHSDAFKRCDSYAESSVNSNQQIGSHESRIAASACAEFLQKRSVPAVLRFEALMTRSIANKNSNALQDALEDLRLAEEVDARNYWVDINRSVILIRLSKEDEAFASLEAALRKGWRNQGPKIEQLSDFDALTRSPRYSEIKRKIASAI